MTVASAFAARFGREPDVIASAPGRVNLIGEHTDYNDGYVLPVAIPQHTDVALGRRGGNMARVWSRELGAASFAVGAERRTRTWIDYVQGMTASLRGTGPIGGFDAVIASGVPVGAGLASSAALEIALGRALREAFGLHLDDVALARAGQRAEHEMVGAPVGLMDQLASSLADTTAALFVDMRTVEFCRVAIPATVELLVMHSGIHHEHAGGEYAARRRECAEAATRLGVASLRDLSLEDLARVTRLPDPLGRRARHVVTENARVLESVRAMRDGDAPTLGRLFLASHRSLRDDYEVSIPEIDRLVDLVCAEPGIFGARITGGGFGGSIVSLAAAGHARAGGDRAAARYEAATGLAARVIVPTEA
jgi:galactokinase